MRSPGSGRSPPVSRVSLPISALLQTFSETNPARAVAAPACASARAIESSSDCGSVISTTTTGWRPSASASGRGRPAFKAATSAAGRVETGAAGFVAGLTLGSDWAGADGAMTAVRGCCFGTTGAVGEVVCRPRTMSAPPRARAAARPSRAAIRTGWLIVVVTALLSSARRVSFFTRAREGSGALLGAEAALVEARARARVGRDLVADGLVDTEPVGRDVGDLVDVEASVVGLEGSRGVHDDERSVVGEIGRGGRNRRAGRRSRPRASSRGP